MAKNTAVGVALPPVPTGVHDTPEPLARLSQGHRSFTVLSSSGKPLHKVGGDNKPPNIVGDVSIWRKIGSYWKSILLSIGISVGALATVVVGVSAGEWAFYKSEFVHHKCLVSAINRSTSGGITPDFSTYREGLGEELWSWIMNPFAFQTVVVVGPRGSGKSTLAHITLKNTAKVITVHLKTDQPFSPNQFSQNILDVLRVPPPENQIMSALSRVEEALAASKKDKRLPIIHVEVDVRCNAKQLQNLLILLKVWGEDLQLVRAVVTLSSSRAALGLSIDMQELRADIFEIEDYTDEEAKQYMHSFIRSRVDCTDEEFRSYCSNLFSQLGRRPLHLKHLCGELLRSMSKQGSSKMSLETLEKNTNTHVKRFTKEYISVLSDFRDKIGDEEKFYNFFKRLQEKPLTLFDTGKMLGIERNYFIQLVSEFTPHPFYINVNKMVHLNTEIERSIDKKALEEALKEEE